jgi:transposase-like protein
MKRAGMGGAVRSAAGQRNLSESKGKVCYLYRAIDRDRNLADSTLSPTRDVDAAQRFFRSAQSMVNIAPKQVTTDGHDAYRRAIRETLGSKVKHRCSACLNRRIERDHRAVKQQYYPILGLGAFPSAQRFCRAFEELRQYFRPRRQHKDLTLQGQTTVPVEST